MTQPDYDIADRYRELTRVFTEKVAAVPSDRWDSPSPCAGWDARDVVDHVVQTHGMFLGLVGRSFPDDIPAVSDDPLAAWSVARDTVQAELDDPVRAKAEFEGTFGRSTFEQAVDGFLGFDQVVHGWDLAHATGLDERIDPVEVQRVAAQADRLGDALRTPGACGPAITPPADADEQTRLLMKLGRQP
ncbi:TIGR03086 family metal-binding protein [Jatrophihabitans sp. DSM 45814]